MAGCAQDVHDLLTSLGIEKDVVLAGLSMGGYVCFEFVRKYQDMLRGLILVATQPVADSEPARQARYETADFVRREGAAALAERLIPRFLGKTTLASKPEVVETLRGLIQSNSPESIAQACLGLAARRDSTPVLSEIKVPTLVVAGSEDTLVPAERAEAMHGKIRGSHLTKIDDCGHLINLEQPKLLERAVSGFLA